MCEYVLLCASWIFTDLDGAAIALPDLDLSAACHGPCDLHRRATHWLRVVE